MMTQKEVEKTFLDNMTKYNVSFLNTNIKIGENMFPSNVISTRSQEV